MSLKVKIKGFANRKDGFFILLVVGLLILVVAVQQLLPSDKPIPFARIDGNLTYLSSREGILSKYRLVEGRELTLKIGEYSATYKIKDLGIGLDEQPTVEPYLAESRLKRLVPFSVLNQMYRDNRPSYTSSQKTLFIATAAIADQVSKDPKNAEILVTDAAPRIQASANGVLFEPEKATSAIFEAIEKNQEEVELQSTVLRPDVTTSELEIATAEFSGSLPEVLTIKTGLLSSTLDKATMLGWLSYEAKDGQPIVKFDNAKVQAYVENLSNTFASSEQPTPTIVNLVDGKESGRIPGKSGKSIISTNLIDAINTAIQDKKTEVSTALVDVPSPIKYTRNYTRSSAGLQDMLNQITLGKEISIKYVDINSRGWDVGSRHNTRSRMASTYKMFVVYSVLKRIEAGTMRMSDPINGKTMDACMQTIIIDSNNECAIAIAEKIGWTTIANEGKALGASGLDWSEELWGTANDASIIPIKLARKEILTEENRNYMLDLMKRQKFRSGMPAGTPYVVADKVGFIDGWLNDAGIVYAPEMTYVLVVYTSGQSWGTIAEITRQIEALAL